MSAFQALSRVLRLCTFVVRLACPENVSDGTIETHDEVPPNFQKESKEETQRTFFFSKKL